MHAVRGSLREERGELCSRGPAPLELWQTTAFNELTFQHIAATETDMNRQCDQQRVLGAFKKLSAVLKKTDNRSFWSSPELQNRSAIPSKRAFHFHKAFDTVSLPPLQWDQPKIFSKRRSGSPGYIFPIAQSHRLDLQR